MLFLSFVTRLADAISVRWTNHKMRKYAVKLKEYIERKEAVILELEEDLKKDLKQMNQEFYKAAVNDLEERELFIRREVRCLIVAYLSDQDLPAGRFQNSEGVKEINDKVKSN